MDHVQYVSGEGVNRCQSFQYFTCSLQRRRGQRVAPSLLFVVRGGYGDLYQCASGGRCKCQIMHYRSKEAQTCGYAVVYEYGALGVWTACGEPAAKGK